MRSASLLRLNRTLCCAPPATARRPPAARASAALRACTASSCCCCSVVGTDADLLFHALPSGARAGACALDVREPGCSARHSVRAAASLRLVDSSTGRPAASPCTPPPGANAPPPLFPPRDGVCQLCCCWPRVSATPPGTLPRTPPGTPAWCGAAEVCGAVVSEGRGGSCADCALLCGGGSSDGARYATARRAPAGAPVDTTVAATSWCARSTREVCSLRERAVAVARSSHEGCCPAAACNAAPVNCSLCSLWY